MWNHHGINGDEALDSLEQGLSSHPNYKKENQTNE